MVVKTPVPEVGNASERAPTSSAKSLLLTMFGEFVAPHGGSVWTGTLVDGLTALGYTDRNARQAIARLRDEGMIRSERHGRRTRWHLTASGDRLFREGTERIYGFGRRADDWDRRWLIVICSVPESQREKRVQLQTRLTFAGFGFASPTMAISPHVSVEPIANLILEELALTDLALVLTAETGLVTPDRAMLEGSWDLAGLGEAYDTFVETISTTNPDTPEAAFVELVRLVHAWRHFPFLDPELPAELLPEEWIGHVARQLFDEAHTAWTPDASTHYIALEAKHD